MMLAGLPVPDHAVEDLADRLECAAADEVRLLALTLDERAIVLASLEDPPQELAELRAVLLADASGFDAAYQAIQQDETADWWSTVHYGLGLPTVVLSAVASTSALSTILITRTSWRAS